MRKLPFYIGLLMILIEITVAVIYYLATADISSESFQFWVMLSIIVLFGIIGIAMFIYGLSSKE